MKKDDILQGMAEIYCYTCERCGQHSLSRDEVHATKSEDICLTCWIKEAKWVLKFFDDEIGASGDYLPNLNKIKKRLK